MKLSEYEIKLLRDLNGEPQEGLSWGAAMGAAIEFLREDGLVTRGPNYRITEKGRALLKDRPAINEHRWTERRHY